MKKNFWVQRISIAFLTTLSFGCTSMFFQPNQYRYPFIEEDGLLFQEKKIASFDGTPLSTWYIPAIENQKKFPGLIVSKVNSPKALVIQFHGNADDLANLV